MKALNLSDLLRNFEGQWVALDKARIHILGSGQTIDQALSSAKEKSTEDPILAFVSRLDLDYVG